MRVFRSAHFRVVKIYPDVPEKDTGEYRAIPDFDNYLIKSDGTLYNKLVNIAVKVDFDDYITLHMSRRFRMMDLILLVFP